MRHKGGSNLLRDKVWKHYHSTKAGPKQWNPVQELILAALLLDVRHIPRFDTMQKPLKPA